jgi:hypothetical protein
MHGRHRTMMVQVRRLVAISASDRLRTSRLDGDSGAAAHPRKGAVGTTPANWRSILTVSRKLFGSHNMRRFDCCVAATPSSRKSLTCPAHVAGHPSSVPVRSGSVRTRRPRQFLSHNVSFLDNLWKPDIVTVGRWQRCCPRFTPDIFETTLFGGPSYGQESSFTSSLYRNGRPDVQLHRGPRHEGIDPELRERTRTVACR